MVETVAAKENVKNKKGTAIMILTVLMGTSVDMITAMQAWHTMTQLMIAAWNKEDSAWAMIHAARQKIFAA